MWTNYIDIENYSSNTPLWHMAFIIILGTCEHSNFRSLLFMIRNDSEF